MITIDGAMGEGGGQVLRSALTLSIVTQKPVQITNIRANRSKPGLRAQHLAAVRAAAAISGAGVDGAFLDSTALTFQPGPVIPGRFSFDIGTAGATSLVLQAIFLPLALAAAPSTVRITGGTHVFWSPCFHYLEMQWLPFMRRLGLDAALTLDAAGFYPQGGGCITAEIPGSCTIKPLRLTDRGGLRRIHGLSAVADLPLGIAERQRKQVLDRLGQRYRGIDIDVAELPSRGKGTVLLLLAEFKNASACYFGLGALGKPAERVADEAVDALEAFLVGSGAVDEYLADQLLLPLALAGGPSTLRTARVTRHLVTNAAVIEAFTPARLEIGSKIGKPGTVRVDL